jgi:hypothetical protein
MIEVAIELPKLSSLRISRIQNAINGLSRDEIDAFYLDEEVKSEFSLTVGDYKVQNSIGTVYLLRNLKVFRREICSSNSGVFQYDLSPPSLIWKKGGQDTVWIGIDSYGNVISHEVISIESLEEMLDESITYVTKFLGGLSPKLADS